METRAVGHPLGLPGRDRRVAHRELILCEFEQGLIARMEVWVDATAIRDQLR